MGAFLTIRNEGILVNMKYAVLLPTR